MKRIFAILAMFFALSAIPAQAQISININIGKQPSWGPSGYDYAQFYFIPELNIYYDVEAALFYYLSGSTWVGAKYLPLKYKKYDLSSMYKVVMNGVTTPWLNNKEHKKTYKNFINDRTQLPIRQTADAKHEPARANTQPWVNNQPKTTTTKSSSSSKKSSSSNAKPATSSTSKPATSTSKPASSSTSKQTTSTSKKSTSSAPKSSSSATKSTSKSTSKSSSSTTKKSSGGKR
ncbi:MAG: hypothetical protein LUC26_01425 [Prevotella sp.]|nr:hypothetical protein [Prevotella sp.]